MIAFQPGAFQTAGFQIKSIAFQSCSFQYPGFQTAECKKPTPAVVTRNSGGGYLLYDGWDSLFKELPRRDKNEEMLVMMAMFAILEDERG